MRFNNVFTIIFLFFLFFSFIVKIALDLINYIHRKKNLKTVPNELKGFVDENKLLEINKYSNSKLIFSLISYFVDKIILLVILFSGLIPFYYSFLSSIIKNVYASVLLFFALFYLIDLIIDIPFSLYFNFVIEKKFNFNKMTIKIWITDLIKNLIISIIIGSILILSLTFFLYNFSNIWWLLLWGFLLAFSFIMQIIYPELIAPLFNKFKPLEKIELKEKIEKLLTESGFKSNGVFEMDATKRSTHSNAYFTGIGKAKKIVLYDSLLQKHSDDEIISILAHELGHYKYRHILKNIIINSLITLLSLFIANILLKSKLLYDAFGFPIEFDIDKAKFVGLYLLSIISGPITFFLTPIFSAYSRKNEKQADKFVIEKTGTGEYLISALKKLTVDNLSNLYPANIYSWFYYSHPPLFKRIQFIKLLEKQGK